jgi:hypothetical protein
VEVEEQHRGAARTEGEGARDSSVNPGPRWHFMAERASINSFFPARLRCSNVVDGDVNLVTPKKLELGGGG